MSTSRLMLTCALAICACAGAAGTALAGEYQSEGPGKAVSKNATFTFYNENGTVASTVVCEEARLSWALKGKATTLPVTPEFRLCKVTTGAYVGDTVEIPNGCTTGLVYNEAAKEEPKEGHAQHSASIKYETGCKIVFKFSSGCEVKMNEGLTQVEKVEFHTLKEKPAEVESVTNQNTLQYKAIKACESSKFSLAYKFEFKGSWIFTGILPS